MRCLRLKKRKDLTRALKSGKRAYAQTLAVAYLPAQRLQFAVCVGKKHGKSVQRNRIKRLLRAAFAQYAPQLGAYHILLLPRPSEEYSFGAFSKDLEKILRRERLIED